MKLQFCLFLFLLAAVNSYAENLVASPERAASWNNVREDSAAKMLTGSGQVETKELIRIDPRKKYRLSAEFETAVPAEYYIGLIPYDGERRQIESVHFHIRPGTETTLLKLCKVQDTVLLVDNASKWVPGKGSAVVFDADDSGNYNDLPNFNIAREVVSKTKQPDGSWLITLSQPAGGSWPAETVIRQHNGYAHYIFAAHRILKKNRCETLSGEISGTCETFCKSNQFWPGTVYVKIVILNFVKRSFSFRNVVLEEVK